VNRPPVLTVNMKEFRIQFQGKPYPAPHIEPVRFPCESPFEVLYKQIVEGKRAHCTVKMATSLRTNRGVPPRIGIAKMEEGVSGPDLGVEIYKISEPSGVTVGCESC